MTMSFKFLRMRKALRHSYYLLLMCACLPLCTQAANDVVVVVNKKNTYTIDRAYVAKIYTGEIRGWPDGTSLIATDVKDAELRESFYGEIVGRSMANMRALWSQNIFTGRGLPPKMLSSTPEVVDFVSRHPNAIGFVSATDLTDENKAQIRQIER